MLKFATFKCTAVELNLCILRTMKKRSPELFLNGKTSFSDFGQEILCTLTSHNWTLLCKNLSCSSEKINYFILYNQAEKKIIKFWNNHCFFVHETFKILAVMAPHQEFISSNPSKCCTLLHWAYVKQVVRPGASQLVFLKNNECLALQLGAKQVWLLMAPREKF